jgi:hypothetical protein
MRADYDSEADTIQIELAPAERLDRDDAEVAGAIVGIRDDQPVLIDVIDTRSQVEERLREVAARFALDADALIAAAQAALAAPDRTVTVDVAARATA